LGAGTCLGQKEKENGFVGRRFDEISDAIGNLESSARHKNRAVDSQTGVNSWAGWLLVGAKKLLAKIWPMRFAQRFAHDLGLFY